MSAQDFAALGLLSLLVWFVYWMGREIGKHQQQALWRDHMEKCNRYVYAVDDLDKWCGHQSPHARLIARHLRAIGEGLGLNAGTPVGDEACQVGGLREQLKRLDAGDVLKNGAELNTSTQQPAPAGATPECLTCNDHGAVGNILTAEPCPDCTRWNAQPAPAAFVDEDHVTVPRSLIGAACSAIDKKQDAPKTLEELRRYTVGDLSAAPQPSPTPQGASSTVLKAIRKANMQLVRTGDDAFMLVPYKVATAHAAESVPAPVLDSLLNIVINHEARATPAEVRSMAAELATYRAARAPAESVPAVSDLPPLPDPDLRDVGTKPQDVKDFLNGYATEYARLALAARAPADSVGRDAPEAALSPQVHLTRNTLLWWRELASINPQDLVPRIDAVLAANGGNK